MKRFFREKDHVRLQPANKAFKPIRTRDAKVLGRVVGVFRRVAMSAVATREPTVRGAERGTAEPPARAAVRAARGRRSRTRSSPPGEELASADRASCPVCRAEHDPGGRFAAAAAPSSS